MCDDVWFVRQHPLESFVHAQKLKRMVTNMNIRWFFCACPFCPVYLLLLFAIHSLNVRGHTLIGTWTYTPRINRTLNERLTDKHRIPAGFTTDTTNRQPNWKTEKTAQNGGIQNTYRITTGRGMDDRQKLIISGHIHVKRLFEISKSDSERVFQHNHELSA